MSINEMKKEDLELLSYKDITNLILEEKGAMPTKALFELIIDKLELPKGTFEKKIGDYYTMLTTDKRFLLLENANWDLRKNHTSDKVVVKIEEDEDLEDELELKEEDEEVSEEAEDSFDLDKADEDEFDDSDDDLKDLVILDEDELDSEE
jgi:DNA-directed RNA polymerase delta subunit.